MEKGIPIIDPEFYASPERCPDSLIEDIFRPAKQSAETIPLLCERIAVLREVGGILCSVRDYLIYYASADPPSTGVQNFGGSFYSFFQAFRERYSDRGTALQLVEMVTETFPAFRDEHMLNGRRGLTGHRLVRSATNSLAY